MGSATAPYGFGPATITIYHGTQETSHMTLPQAISPQTLVLPVDPEMTHDPALALSAIVFKQYCQPRDLTGDTPIIVPKHTEIFL